MLYLSEEGCKKSIIQKEKSHICFVGNEEERKTRRFG